MDIIQSIVLGMVQGLTEFLPVSSSGHLILIPVFLGWPQHDRAFDAVLHLGTLLAILFYFRHEIVSMLLAIKGDIINYKKLIEKLSDPIYSKNPLKILVLIHPFTKLSITIVVISLPIFIAGLKLDSLIEEVFTDYFTVGLFMLFGTVIMIFADKKQRQSVDLINSLDETARIPFLKSLVISMTQIAAMFPGVSRSGITISTALFLGIERNIAARFTFIMSIPVILGAGVYKLKDLNFNSDQLVISIAGLFSSFIFGALAIKILLVFISKYGFRPFILYRFVVVSAIFIYYFS